MENGNPVSYSRLLRVLRGITMTTIVVDRKFKIMAADKLACVGGNNVKVTKITKVYSPKHEMMCCFATAGNYEQGALFEQWFYRALHEVQDDSTYPVEGDFNGLVLYEDGSLFLYLPGGQPIQIQDRFYGIGSGADAALGAIHMGANCSKAVKIASKIDNGTGLGVQIVTL